MIQTHIAGVSSKARPAFRTSRAASTPTGPYNITHPAEGFGRLLPDLALPAATGGAGAGVKGARMVKEAAGLASDARNLERAASRRHPQPARR
ncbi:hypothetical protein [Streptomyces sp. DH8]|uniref:hypothetical protein n=1 Tax=Streptomyces sp. DH8 TaxID=2857008 RepID=UPI0027D23209|nr:hypothetical protein [Streptomyces sp. DH8]